MKNPYRIKINLQRYTIAVPKDLLFVSGDNETCKLEFEVMTDDYSRFNYTGKVAKLVMRLPETNTLLIYDCVIDDGIAKLTLPIEAITEIGKHLCELQILDSQTQAIRVTCPRFTYPVRESLQKEVI